MSKWIGERISTKDHDDGTTTIVIYPKKSKVKELLLMVWVIGFTLVGIYMFYLLFGGLEKLNPGEEDVVELREKQQIYLFVFVGFWVYFEYFTLRALLWYKFGKEFLKIDSVALTVKRSYFSYGRAHRYLFENVKKLSMVEADPYAFSNFFDNAFWSLGTDSIEFQHFGKGKSFGRRMDEKSTKLLIRLIDDRVKKQLRKKH